MDDLQNKGEAEGEGEQEEEEEDGWKTRAPGFKRGVQLSGGMCPNRLITYHRREREMFRHHD